MIQSLTIKDQRGNWFNPHLCVDQVGPACFPGAALASHDFSHVGSLGGGGQETRCLQRRACTLTSTGRLTQARVQARFTTWKIRHYLKSTLVQN